MSETFQMMSEEEEIRYCHQCMVRYYSILKARTSMYGRLVSALAGVSRPVPPTHSKNIATLYRWNSMLRRKLSEVPRNDPPPKAG